MIWFLRVTVVLSIALAGAAEALSWSRYLWVAGLVTAALCGLTEIAIAIKQSSPVYRVKSILAGITHWVLRDVGDCTLTVYQRAANPTVYVPVLRYSRATGLLLARRYTGRPTLNRDLQLTSDDASTTLGQALLNIGGFYYIEDIPEFTSRAEMESYYTGTRAMRQNTVRQFSDRVIGVRSVGSIAIVDRAHDNDVVGVLTIDSTVPDKFASLTNAQGKLLTDQLAFWSDRLAWALT